MTEREKLIDLLLRMNIKDTVGNIADFLIANGVTVKQWIPVTERLPDVWQHPGDDEHVGEPIDFIVFIHGALIPTTLWFNGESFFDESGYLYNVTHWMPMPEPPKGD